MNLFKGIFGFTPESKSVSNTVESKAAALEKAEGIRQRMLKENKSQKTWKRPSTIMV